MAIDYSSYTQHFSGSVRQSSKVAGVVVSVAVPLAAAVALKSGMDAPGITAVWATNLPFGLTPAALTMVWFALFPTWGIAYWLSSQNGDDGRSVSRGVLAVMAAGAIAPFAIPLLDPLMTGLASTLLLLLVVGVTARLAQVSRAAALWMVPSLLALGVGSLLGFTAVAQGWSPPFAVTDPINGPAVL